MNYEQNNERNYPNTNVEYNYNYANPNGYYVTNQMPLSYHIKRFLIGLLLAFLLIFLLVMKVYQMHLIKHLQKS